jgi:hypothetical protein
LRTSFSPRKGDVFVQARHIVARSSAIARILVDSGNAALLQIFALRYGQSKIHDGPRSEPSFPEVALQPPHSAVQASRPGKLRPRPR